MEVLKYKHLKIVQYLSRFNLVTFHPGCAGQDCWEVKTEQQLLITYKF